jgi:hypothetical protein
VGGENFSASADKEQLQNNPKHRHEKPSFARFGFGYFSESVFGPQWQV